MIWNKKINLSLGKEKNRILFNDNTTPSLMRKGIFSKLLIKDYKLMAKKREKKKNCTNRKSENSKMKKKVRNFQLYL